MVVHQNITNLAGYFHFLNVRKIPYVILGFKTPYEVFLEDANTQGLGVAL